MKITFENFKNFVGKPVEVDIMCYHGGLIYPDNNILLWMNKGYYYFLSEKGTENEQVWHYEVISEKGCTIDVISPSPKEQTT